MTWRIYRCYWSWLWLIYFPKKSITMSFQTKCAFDSKSKDYKQVYGTGDWISAALYWNQSDFIENEYSGLQATNNTYDSAWKNKDMQEFRSFWNRSAIKESIWKNRDYANKIREIAYQYIKDWDETAMRENIKRRSLESEDWDFVFYLAKWLQWFINTIRWSEKNDHIVSYIEDSLLRQLFEWTRSTYMAKQINKDKTAEYKEKIDAIIGKRIRITNPSTGEINSIIVDWFDWNNIIWRTVEWKTWRESKKVWNMDYVINNSKWWQIDYWVYTNPSQSDKASDTVWKSEWFIETWDFFNVVETTTDESDGNENVGRGKLTAFLWLSSNNSTQKNNILKMLSLFRWYEHNIRDDWSEYLKKENFNNWLFWNSDELFIRQFEQLFWESKNDLIRKNTSVFKNAFANLTGNTNYWRFKKAINSLMKFSAPLYLSKFYFNIAAATMMWVSSWFISYVTLKSLKKSRPDKELKKILNEVDIIDTDIGYDDFFSSLRQEWWLKKWFNSTLLVAWVTGKQVWFDDTSGKVDWFLRNSKWFNNPFFEWMTMGMPNFIWDTLFRGEYMIVAMDRAMKRLWRNGPATNYLYQNNPDGTRSKNIENTLILKNEFIDSFTSLIGTSNIEWGTQTTRWWYNKVYSYMSQWASRYINDHIYRGIWANIYHLGNALWWVEKIPLIWQDILNMYSSKLEDWYSDLPWTAATDHVTKEESIRELIKLTDAFQMMFRFQKEFWCRNEDGTVDRQCSMNKFLWIAYLPSQALQMAHPLINNLIHFVTQSIIDNPMVWEDTPMYKQIAESFSRNMIRPFLRAFFVPDIIAETIKQSIDSPEKFWEILRQTYLKRSQWLLYYISDDVDSYLLWANAYVPKSFSKDSNIIFWVYNWWFKDWVYEEAAKAKKIDNMSVMWFLFWNFPMVRHFLYPDWSDPTSKMIAAMDKDPEMKQLFKWEIPQSLENNKEFMESVYLNLTKDRATYWAQYDENWVRINKDDKWRLYNQWEITLWELMLKDAMDKELKKDPTQDKLTVYSNAMKIALSTESYSNMKNFMSAYYDKTGKWSDLAYMDYLWAMQHDTKLAWVKWLAIASEYRKLELMKQVWLEYKKEAPAAEKEVIKIIETQVAKEFGPLLSIVDVKQRHNVTMKAFVDKYPEFAGAKVFKNIIWEDWSIDNKWTITTDTQAWVALRSYSLARGEIAKGNVNWYQLLNVLTEKLWSPIWADFKIDTKKATNLTNSLIYISKSMDEMWLSTLDKTHILLPTMTKNLELWSQLRSNKELFANLGEDKVNYIENILYNDYKWIKDIEKALEYTKDYNTIANKYYWKTWSWYGYSRNSSYYWKTPYKDYDTYKPFYPKFLERGSNNLSRLSNAYGKWNSYEPRESYNSREYAYLNARARWNPLISQRIAPDIQFSGGWFSRKSVKVSLAYGLGWAARIETKNPKFVSNKTIARWEWIDRQLSDNRIKRYNNVSNKGKSKNRSTWSRLSNNSRGNKVSR